MKKFHNILVVAILLTSYLPAQDLPPKRFSSNSTDLPTDFNYVAKKSGHYTAEDWAIVIDSTWGEGLPTESKLALFNAAWNMLDDDYAAFQNLDIDWQAIYDLYRPEIEAGVSRGRFAAIMNYMVLALQENHSWVWNDPLTNTPLEPGVPLFCVSSNSDNTSHFGASLTPLPDSSLFVIKALPDHPIGLVPGDQVLGYDGIPWKILYKELLAAQLPFYRDWYKGYSFPPSDNENSAHLYLVSAGMNWHLFDTLDVVKYGSTDTLHYPTSSLAGQTDFIWGNEQLPIPGVPWPYEGTENIMDPLQFGDFISWGIVEGTNIGYIYALAWPDNQQIPGSNIAIEFFNALDSLMNHYNTEGLIIDQRLNFGGRYEFQQGFSVLFNNIFQPLGFDKRCDPDNHFEMCPRTPTNYDLITRGDPETFHDRPIAVLTGPASVSAGDFSALILKMHPMARLFGKPTNGAFSTYGSRYLTGNNDWIIWRTLTNAYRFDDLGNYLAHKALAVDEEVWLTQVDVAKGEDTVVKRAVEWIQNLAHAHDVTVDKLYIDAGSDSINVTAIVENPNEHQLSVIATIRNQDSTITEQLDLYNDGLHGDGTADDNLWGNIYLPTPDKEELYKVSVTTDDLTEETSRTLPNVACFTTVGPVEPDMVQPFISEAYSESRNRESVKVVLHNHGSSTEAKNITLRITTTDPRIDQVSGNGSFGDIAAGKSDTSSTNLYIYYTEGFTPDSTHNNPVQFDFEVYSNGLPFWESSIDFASTVVSIEDYEVIGIPKQFSLSQNYPNPFNPVTMIDYQLPMTSHVELNVFNLLGQKIATLVNERLQAGYHQMAWEASGFASGVYYYQLIAGDYREVRKMILLR
jgi:hypothetical protein